MADMDSLVNLDTGVTWAQVGQAGTTMKEKALLWCGCGESGRGGEGSQEDTAKPPQLPIAQFLHLAFSPNTMEIFPYRCAESFFTVLLSSCMVSHCVYVA